MDRRFALLVEDNRRQAELWKAQLELDIPELTAEITVTADQAVASFGEKVYDVVVLDVMMYPRKTWNESDVAYGFLSGVALHQDFSHICKKQGRALPPVIIVSAIQGARTGLFNGAMSYFSRLGCKWIDKPVDPDELVEAVREVLGLPEEGSRDAHG